MFPLIRLTIALVLGMVTAIFYVEHRPVSFAFLELLFVLMCLFAGVMLWVSRPRASTKAKELHFGMAACAFVYVTGMALFSLKCIRQPALIMETSSVNVELTATPRLSRKSYSLPVRMSDGRQFLAHVGRGSDSDDRLARLQVGDSLSLSCTHWTPTEPWLDRDNEFRTYWDYLYYHGMTASCYVPAHRWKRLSQHNRELSFWTKLRQQIHQQYVESGIDQPTVALLDALTFGEKSQIPKQVREAFAAAGLSHVLALSGMHLTILVMLLNIVLVRNLFSLRWRSLSCVVLIVAIWLFVMLADAPPSLVRAAVMCTLLQISPVIQRDHDMLNACALAAFLMLVIDPFALCDVGFQLSFVSIIGIGVLAEPLLLFAQRHLPQSRVLHFFLTTIVLTFACSIATFPLVAYHFGRVPMLGLVSNLFVSLTLLPTMLLLCGYWMVCFWPAAQVCIMSALSYMINGMSRVAHAVASISFSTVSYQPGRFETVALYCLLASCLYFAYRRTSRSLMLIFGSVMLFCVSRLSYVL